MLQTYSTTYKVLLPVSIMYKLYLHCYYAHFEKCILHMQYILASYTTINTLWSSMQGVMCVWMGEGEVGGINTEKEHCESAKPSLKLYSYS